MKIRRSVLQIRKILFVIVFLLILLGSALYFKNITGNIVRSDYPADYAPPYNLSNPSQMVFRVSPEYIDASAGIISLNVNVSMPQGFIYKKGFIYNFIKEDWDVFNFEQSPVPNSYWVQNFVSANLVFDSSNVLRNGENYLVAYACEKKNNVWQCGCNDLSSTECANWMLQVINLTNVPNPRGDIVCTSDEDCYSLDKCDLDRGVCVSDSDNLIPLGTPQNPFKIYNWTDLNNIRNNLTASYILMNNLSSSSAGYRGLGDNWQPIGYCIDSFGGHSMCDPGLELERNPFSGNLEGNNKVISNLIMNLPSDGANVGLFGYATGNISNLGLVDINVTGGDRIAGLVGHFGGGYVHNSFATGNVTGETSTGGLVGDSYGVVDKSYFIGNVYGQSLTAGLVAKSIGNISNSFSAGIVNGPRAGGLVASQQNGIIENSYSSANVYSSESYAGGLVGATEAAIINNSYSIGRVAGSAEYVGGLVARLISSQDEEYNDLGFIGLINNSYWDKTTSKQSTSAGGIGKKTSEMKNISTFSNWDTSIWRLMHRVYPSFEWENKLCPVLSVSCPPGQQFLYILPLDDCGNPDSVICVDN